jgi:hypothetical protein
VSVHIVEMSLGGKMRVKVEAKDRDAALLLAQHYFIDDWENAGPLKLADVDIDEVYNGDPEVPEDDIDASIFATGEDSWEYAKDDPIQRGEEV